VLADMVRNGCYTRGEDIGPDARNQFLLVLAVPYGAPEEIETKTEAIEAFRNLLDKSDWFERQIQILTLENGEPHVEEVSHEDLEARSETRP
jgi:hypothetical protein